MDIKILDEVLVDGNVIDSEVLIVPLHWGEEFPLGVARIVAVEPDRLSLIILDPIDKVVVLSPGITSPAMIFNGEKMVGLREESFAEGDCFSSYFTYGDRDYYVTRQTVTIEYDQVA